MKKPFAFFLKICGFIPSLDSQRLRYEKFSVDDFNDYYSYVSNPSVMQYIGNGPLKGNEAKLKFEKLLETNERFRAYGFFKAITKQEGKFVGLAKFDFLEKGKVEVGYALLPEFWGKGFASEMLKSMVKYGRQIREVKELLGLVDPENPASKKVLTKLEFKLFDRGYFNEAPTEYFKLSV